VGRPCPARLARDPGAARGCQPIVVVTSWLRTSIQFTADDLAFTMLLWPRRIPWTHVAGVTLQDNYDSDADPEDVTHRRVLIRYQRDPGSPLPPMPTVFGEYRIWARAHFLPMSLPLSFPVALGESIPGAGPREAWTWIGRRADRQRETIREEFAARGYPLPE
jgi:hypothetical protein